MDNQTMAAAVSQAPALDDRQLEAQLPAGLSRGDEAAIDAVMQLAAFTEQQHQQHQHQQHHDEHGSPSQEGASASVSQDTKTGRKRKANNAPGGGKAGSDKIRKEDGDSSHLEAQGGAEDDSQQQQHHNWASFSGQNNEFEHLLQQDAGDESANNQSLSMDQGQDVGDASGEILTRHGRPLSTTKRAAQNRAAQRAFRERRDQHFKDVEAKAKQVDEALASAAMHKQRYEDLLRTIAGLRQDNQSLRLAINALGGNPPPPPPAATAFPSINGEGDIANWLQDLNGEQHEMEQQGKEGNNNDGHLEGLSAVAAAAAAAAAAHAVGQEGDDRAAPVEDEKDEAAAAAAVAADEQAR